MMEGWRKRRRRDDRVGGVITAGVRMMRQGWRVGGREGL